MAITDLDAMTRICARCKEEKSLNDYHANRKDAVAGKQSYCKPCVTESRQERHAADPTYYQNVQLKTLYGITYEIYEQMLEDQNNVCAICKSEGTATLPGTLRLLHVDHCHETGKVRGLLCNKCNTGLGLFNDDISLLRDAMSYLDSDGTPS